MQSSATNREVRLASRPVGMPTPDDFTLAETPLRQPADGELLVRNLWMSVDPYMRGQMVDQKSYVTPFQVGEALYGRAVGVVVESRHSDFAPGDHVFHMLGWREYATGSWEGFEKIDVDQAPAQAYLGVLGAPGLTAYTGLFRIAELKDGDSVFVSAAAGAVGSVACQLARAHGCRVVASAGTDEKCAWLRDVAGVDATINYRTCGDLNAALAAAAPEGLDVYFDNVGGGHLEAALNQMKVFGRIALCGMIGGYNDLAPAPGPGNLMLAISRSLKLQGFVVRHHMDLRPRFREETGALIRAGKMHVQETVEHGLENAPAAFLKLFTGDNTGKMLVKLG